MGDDELAVIIENHKKEIAEATARELWSKGAYNGASQDQLITFLQPSLDMVIHYFHSLEVKIIQDYMENVGRVRREMGFSMEDMALASQVMAKEAAEVVDRVLPGPENEAGRARFRRRINSIQSLSQVSMVKSHMVHE